MINQTKTFFLGLSVSFLILVSFFAGAVADRLFVIQPVDFLTGKVGSSVLTKSNSTETNTSKLGTLLAEQSSIADVAEVAAQAVVTVSIKQQEQVLQTIDPFGMGFGFLQIPSGKTQEVQADIGTGFVVDEQGLIVTNKHVVSATQATYLVIDQAGNEYEVEKIYRDPSSDLAILQAKNFQMAALPMGNSDELRVGEEVIAIGTALGEFRHTVTTGVISGLGRGIQALNVAARTAEDLEGLIQTDAAINFGNSGGPLLDRSGQVIGVNVAVSTSAENIGFALPINLVKASIDNFKKTGSFERPYLGVTYRMIPEESALLNNVPAGAYLLEISKNSPADQAGLKKNDIITQINGESLKDGDLATIVNQLSIGQQVEVEYWRNEKLETVEVTLIVR